MASIKISADDFVTVAIAACNAQRDGDDASAKTLDRIARKIRAALTRREISIETGKNMRDRELSWHDMPSTLDGAK